jgi:hypothetical protein
VGFAATRHLQASVPNLFPNRYSSVQAEEGVALNWILALVLVFWGFMTFATATMLARMFAKAGVTGFPALFGAMLAGIFWPLTFVYGMFNGLKSE